MKPEPCTVSSVPPDAGPEVTLRLLTVALWYVKSTPLSVKLSELSDIVTTSAHQPGPHPAVGVRQRSRDALSSVATTTVDDALPANLQRASLLCPKPSPNTTTVVPPTRGPALGSTCETNAFARYSNAGSAAVNCSPFSDTCTVAEPAVPAGVMHCS
eukprot:207815-Prymnesium_polylepis.1